MLRSALILSLVVITAALAEDDRPSVADCIQAERELSRSLRRPVILAAGEYSVEQFGELVSEAYEIDVRVDLAELRNAGVPVDHKVRVTEVPLTLVTHLRNFLPETLGFGWTTDGGTLVLTSAAAAEETLTARVYGVTDLVEWVDPPPQPPAPSGFFQFGPGGGLGQAGGAGGLTVPTAGFDYAPLMETIESSTDYEMWESAGGDGSISQLTVRGRALLVIRQTEPMHLEVERLLHLIRERVEEEPPVEIVEAAGEADE